MSWVEQIKEALPDYAKDTKLNLDAVITRSSLPVDVAMGCALAAAMMTGNGKLVSFIQTDMHNTGAEFTSALTAAAIMAQNNVWYPYIEMAEDENLKGLPAQLRMNAIASHGGTTKSNFEAFSLAASIVGKCHFCVKAHYETLKKEGYTVEQLRDIGRIAAVMNSVAKVLNS
jgi:alkyl hydroperoxide reductase subunit D